jgi:hypothetical protein
MNFTYNNHLTYTIGGRRYGWRTNSIEPYTVSVGKADMDHYRSSSYSEELRRTADLVRQDLGNDLVLFLSGGTDSEIVLRNFLSIGVKPKCYTIRFVGGFNSGDVAEAFDLANTLDVDLEAIDFDVKDFYFSGEAEEFGNLLQCTQVTYLMVYYCVRKLGLPAVMGGELLMKRNINTDPYSWYYCLRENEDCSAMRFSQLYGIPLVNEWFSYTPELMLYWLEHEDIQGLVAEKFNYKLSSVSSKNSLLRKLQPDIRVRKKTHGFEALLGFNYEAYRGLANSQIARLEDSLDGIEYHRCLEMLRGNCGHN